ncbi:MAG TPA: hypothetical protein VKA46_29665 [Gemmataceae bacterium]|nr:hypothetical protein [Gemmataceae bacterium]
MNDLTPRQAARCRRLAGAKRCPVVVVEGTSAPRAVGERGSNEFKTGGLVHHPGSAIRAGCKVRYVRSTYRVEVGHRWLFVDGLPDLLRTLPAAVLRWHDGTVRRIAEGIHAERAFDRLPILADALLDAGCEDEALMARCREGGAA